MTAASAAGVVRPVGGAAPLQCIAVQPTVVVEVEVDAAFDEDAGQWRHRARFLRVRADLSAYDVRRMSAS
ncbi:hypothetical protein ACPPVO_22690 [Dactylosporangium sp. McL0621]|uniref:hypothetical protein n=1 Tax=Dactylosporangium sp. McL0621 TaxID=3415678 RepID=UPI003CFB1E0B